MFISEFRTQLGYSTATTTTTTTTVAVLRYFRFVLSDVKKKYKKF